MTEIYVSELGEFCMGRRFFWLPKGGVAERGVGHGRACNICLGPVKACIYFENTSLLLCCFDFPREWSLKKLISRLPRSSSASRTVLAASLPLLTIYLCQICQLHTNHRHVTNRGKRRIW
jgi:hypothetical protein